MKKTLLKTVLNEDQFDNVWICGEIRPAYKYEDDVRTDTVEGVVYRCVHPQAITEGVFDIKVIGAKPCVNPKDIPQEGVEITFDGLTFIKWRDRRTGSLRTSGRADSALLADPHA